MNRPIVLVGGGEHARVVADALVAAGRRAELAGYLDHGPVDEMERRFGLAYLGRDEQFAWQERRAILCFGGIQAAARRVAAIERLERMTGGWATVIHPTAVVSMTALIGAGTVVLAGAVVNTGAHIGPHAVINTGAIVEHDSRIGAHVQVGPRAVLGGGVHVGEGGYIGIGAVLRDHVSIGEAAVVGMGAVVTKDVPPRTLAVGNPARHRELTP